MYSIQWNKNEWNIENKHINYPEYQNKTIQSQGQGKLQIFTINVLYHCVACFHMCRTISFNLKVIQKMRNYHLKLLTGISAKVEASNSITCRKIRVAIQSVKM